MSELRVSPALNVEADNQANAKSNDLEERNAHLALSNRILRDRITELVELLRSFGVEISP